MHMHSKLNWIQNLFQQATQLRSLDLFFNKMQELSYYVKIFPMFSSATQTANPHLKKTTALVQSCKGSCLSLKPNGVPQHTDIKRKLNKHCTYIFTHFALKYRNRETQEQPNNLSPWKVTSYTHARIWCSISFIFSSVYLHSCTF